MAEHYNIPPSKGIGEMFLKILRIKPQRKQIIDRSNLYNFSRFAHKVDGYWAFLSLFIFCQRLAAGTAGGNRFRNLLFFRTSGNGNCGNILIGEIGAGVKNGYPFGTKARWKGGIFLVVSHYN